MWLLPDIFGQCHHYLSPGRWRMTMSERRPHWDDELIFAVMSAAGDGGHLFIDDIHAVIAAVEDWQDRHTPSPESEGNRK